MSKTINSDLIRGNINTIILKSLYEGDRYGYDIIKEIEEKSHGQYILKQPTLYSCLKRLENQGFITAYWGEQTNGGRRKYYTLTDMGREVFIQYQDEYEFSRTIIDQLISERDYDLESVERPVSEEPEEAALEAEADVEIEQPANAEYDKEVEATEASPAEDTEVIAADENEEPSVDAESPETVGATHPQLNDEPLSVNATSLIDELLYEDKGDTYSDSAATEPQKKHVRIEESSTSSYLESIYPSEQYAFSEDTPPVQDADSEASANSTSMLADFLDFSSPSKPEAAEKTEQKSQHEFRSYNTGPIHDASPAVATERKSNPHYKSVLAGLVSDFDTPADTQPAQDKLTKDEIIAESNLSVKERVQVRNFGKLTESIKELGENVKIRTPDSFAAREYNKQYYYYRNKLRLFQYGIIFLVMLLESFLTYVVIKNGAKIHTSSDVPLYVCSILLSLAFPIFAGITYLLEPFKRKRIDFNFKNSMLFRTVIMVQLIVIIYALNVYLGMPIGFSSEYALSTALPMILTTNIPLCGIIHRALYKSKIFAVEN